MKIYINLYNLYLYITLGVNWCAFHPSLNLIISGADDRKIKLWK